MQDDEMEVASATGMTGLVPVEPSTEEEKEEYLSLKRCRKPKKK